MTKKKKTIINTTNQYEHNYLNHQRQIKNHTLVKKVVQTS